MIRAVLLLFTVIAASPALADNGHSGVATPRTAPEASDMALFVMAAGAIWFTRRALRRRLPRRD
jgi:hypothetical protein